VIKGAAGMATALGLKAFIIPNGYAGLYNLVDMKGLVHLDVSRLELINAALAGSEAGHSRVAVKKIPTRPSTSASPPA
jgi:6-phosphofructokinase 1